MHGAGGDAVKSRELAALSAHDLLKLRAAIRAQLRLAEQANPASADERAATEAMRARLRAIEARLHEPNDDAGESPAGPM